MNPNICSKDEEQISIRQAVTFPSTDEQKDIITTKQRT